MQTIRTTDFFLGGGVNITHEEAHGNRQLAFKVMDLKKVGFMLIITEKCSSVGVIAVNDRCSESFVDGKSLKCYLPCCFIFPCFCVLFQNYLTLLPAQLGECLIRK